MLRQLIAVSSTAAAGFTLELAESLVHFIDINGFLQHLGAWQITSILGMRTGCSYIHTGEKFEVKTLWNFTEGMKTTDCDCEGKSMIYIMLYLLCMDPSEFALFLHSFVQFVCLFGAVNTFSHWCCIQVPPALKQSLTSTLQCCSYHFLPACSSRVTLNATATLLIFYNHTFIRQAVS